MLSIAPSPDEAYDICTKYAPDCATNKYSSSHGKQSSDTRPTVSRSSSRHTSTRGNSKKKKQSFNSVHEVKSSTGGVGSSVTNQNEVTGQRNVASRSSQVSQNESGGRQTIKISSQSHHSDSIAAPKVLKANNGNNSNFAADSASYSDDYFDTIDESFYDDGDLHRTSTNLTNESIGNFSSLQY